MNKIERLSMLKANSALNASEEVAKMLATVNGDVNVSEGDIITFAPTYKVGENISVQETNTGNKYLTFAVTIGDTYNEEDTIFVSSGSFARRFSFVDIDTKERKVHTLDGKPFKGSNESFLKEYAGKKLKWESSDRVNTQFGETVIRNWITVE